MEANLTMSRLSVEQAVFVQLNLLVQHGLYNSTFFDNTFVKSKDLKAQLV